MVGEGRLFILFNLVLREVTPVNLGAERYDTAQELLSPMKFNIRQPTPIGDEASGLTEVSTKAPHPKEHVHQGLMDELTPAPLHPGPVYALLRLVQQAMCNFQLLL